MANLLDAIRGNSAPQQQGVTDETSKLQTLLRAKSGKASAGGPVASSNLGETQAVTQTNQQLGQVAAQNEIQNQTNEQQSLAQDQSAQLQNAEINQSRRFDTIQNRLKTDSLLSEYERNKGQLDLSKDKANAEQIGVTLRLGDQQYVSNLQREGAKARLDDDNTFKTEMLKTSLGDQQEILEKNLGNKSILDASDREFQKSLAQMGIDDAWAMFRADQRAGQQQAMWTGIGNVATAGVGAYGAYDKSQSEQAATDNKAATGIAKSESSSSNSDLARMHSMKD